VRYANLQFIDDRMIADPALLEEWVENASCGFPHL
jgi:hypothetical protein